jgi:hypothetical protein
MNQKGECMKNNSLSLFVRRPAWGGRIRAFRMFCLAAVFMSLFSGLGLAQDAPSATITGSGTTDFIPLWTNSTTLGNSAFFQLGTGAKAKVGIGTTKPASTLDVKGGGTIRGLLSLPTTGTATTSTGFNSQPMNFAASVFNSSASEPVTQTFQWQAEPVGNDTDAATGSLNLLFGQGSTKPTETGLNIGSKGQITFAIGQTFPGTGTVTSVGSGAGLTGGPITTSGTLSIATGGVTNAMLTNPSLTVTAGTALTGGGAVALGGSTTLNVDTTKVPLLGGANGFTNNNSFAGFIEVVGQGDFGRLNVSNAGNTNAGNLENDSSNATLQLINGITPAEGTFMAAFFNGDGKDVFDVDTLGDTFAAGSKSAVVPLRSGEMVELFSMESPEVWFEDFGSGRLSGGVTTISLDPRFTQTVNLPLGYHVFITPKGDCKGLFVTGETNGRFEVRELGGGKSSVEFDYRIVAHRNGYEGKRMPAAKRAVIAKLNRAGAVINKKK